MIRDQNRVDVVLAEQRSSLFHVDVSVVHQCLLKPGQRTVDIAEVYLEDSSAGTKVANHLVDILAHTRSAFRPRSDAETQAEVIASRDVDRSLIRICISENPRYTSQNRDRRIVGVQSDAYACFFRYWHHGAYEARESIPDLFLAVFPAMRIRESDGFVQIEESCLQTARGRRSGRVVRRHLDVGHVRVGRVVYPCTT